jgi:hypothetical protein
VNKDEDASLTRDPQTERWMNDVPILDRYEFLTYKVAWKTVNGVLKDPRNGLTARQDSMVDDSPFFPENPKVDIPEESQTITQIT